VQETSYEFPALHTYVSGIARVGSASNDLFTCSEIRSRVSRVFLCFSETVPVGARCS
jgi:hypothetical protein